MIIELHSRKRRQAERRRKVLKKGLGLFGIGLLAATLCGTRFINKPSVVGWEYKTGACLWELAEGCPESVDKRDMIREIMKVNGMKCATVYSERLYMVPVYEE